jgi:stage II sporulation protein D
MAVWALALRLGVTAFAVGLGVSAAQVAAAAEGPDPHWIRVMLATDQPTVEIEVDGPVKLWDAQAHRLLGNGAYLPQTIVRADREGIYFGSQFYPAAKVHLVATQEAGIRLNGVRLRGSLEISRQSSLQVRAINIVPLEEYLRGVLSKEAPDYWPAEALKAIAIAARTYAVHRRYLNAAQDYDVTSSVMSQEYGGRSAEKHATTEAVAATQGTILLYAGQIFPTFYHSSCGKVTENGQVMGKEYNIPPLQGGVPCYGEASPFYSWKRRFTPEDINWVLHKSSFGTVGAVQDLRIDRYTPLGRVEQITVVGNQRELPLKGYDFRSLFGFEKLRSL